MKKTLILLFASFALATFAQEEGPALSISGTVDVYFQTALTAPDTDFAGFGSSFTDGLPTDSLATFTLAAIYSL